MRAIRALAAVLLIAGVALAAAAVATGEADLALLIILPVIYGGGALLALSILLLLGAFVLLFLSFPAEERDREARTEGSGRTERRAGGVILIGPIPIIFGSKGALSDRWLILSLIVLTIIGAALFLVALLA